MPDWQPNWDDVVFDHAAADEAAAACRAAARQIDEVRGEMPGHRTTALEEWRGRYADDFDVEEVAVGRELDAVAADLRALARSIDAAAEAATTEQSNRAADRVRWREELEEENRLRRMGVS